MNNNDDSKTKLVDNGWIEYINQVGDFIYFVSSNKGICKVKTDGFNKINIYKGNYISNLIVDGDWIYYISRIDGNLNLCKIRTDGTEFTKLNDDSCDSIGLTKDWIYCKSTRYAEDSNYKGPAFEIRDYKINKDGNGKQVMNSYVDED